MKARQTTARLLGGHLVGNFRAHLLKSAPSIKPISCLLNLSSAHNHLCESERPRFGLCTIEHALRNAQTAVAFIEVHSAKLSVVDTATFDSK
jgi:hypothetical protein